LSTNEAFSRVVIDAQVRDQGWKVEDPNAVRYEYLLPVASAWFVFAAGAVHDD